MSESALDSRPTIGDQLDTGHFDLSGTSGQEAGRRPWSRWYPNLLVVGAYTVGAFWVTAHLWRHPRDRGFHELASNSFHIDQYQFEYFLAHAARIFTHGANPLFDTQVNAPVGVNLMANTSTLGLTIPMVPVTLLFGPAIAFVVLAILAPLTTAVAWYLLFFRYLRLSRWAAFVGGAFCGFGPGIITETDGHLNLATQFAVPLIVWRLLVLATDRRYVRNGLLLGLAVVYQAFVNEEVLLMIAVGCLVFCLVWAVSEPSRARAVLRQFLAGLAVAGGAAVILLGYPLWFEFFGPQSYRGLGNVPQGYGNDLRSFAMYPLYSLAGDNSSLGLDYPNLQHAFLGPPLVVALLVIAVAFWRNATARSAVAVALVAAVLSLGYRLRYDSHYFFDFGPWRLLGKLPILDSVVPTRFGLVLGPPVGFLLALAVDQIRMYRGLQADTRLRLIAYAGLAAVLVPLIPTPIDAIGRPPTPSFISTGEWRGHVKPGHSLLSVPVNNSALNMAQAASQGLDYAIPSGYFLAPNPASAHRTAMFGTTPRATDRLWNEAINGPMPTVTAADRERADEDFRYWHASVLIIAQQPGETQLREVTTQLLGRPPTRTGGVWLWDLPY